MYNKKNHIYDAYSHWHTMRIKFYNTCKAFGYTVYSITTMLKENIKIYSQLFQKLFKYRYCVWFSLRFHWMLIHFNRWHFPLWGFTHCSNEVYQRIFRTIFLWNLKFSPRDHLYIHLSLGHNCFSLFCNIKNPGVKLIWEGEKLMALPSTQISHSWICKPQILDCISMTFLFKAHIIINNNSHIQAQEYIQNW